MRNFFKKKTLISVIVTLMFLPNFIYATEADMLISAVTDHAKKTLKETSKVIKEHERDLNVEELPLYNITSQKLWMDYRAITDTSSPQWAITRSGWGGDDGILRYGDYICIALGQSYGAVGDKFIIQIGDKKVKCIIADQKKYCDTLYGEGWLDPYGNLLEILVDVNYINNDCRVMGDMNYTPALSGEVTHIWKILE